MDNLVLGQRLHAHRTAAGWSLRELSKRLNSRVTPQALSQYETGRTCPRSEVLRALARVLGTRVEQLGREPDPVRLGAIQFRHPMTLTPAVLNRAHGQLMTLTERSLALEQRVGCPLAPPSLPFIAEIEHVRTPEDAEGPAQDVRRRWGLGTGPLPHLVSLFEARGIRVFESFQREDDSDFNGVFSIHVLLCGIGVGFSRSPAEQEPLGRTEEIHTLSRTRSSHTSEFNARPSTRKCSGTSCRLVCGSASPPCCQTA